MDEQNESFSDAMKRINAVINQLSEGIGKAVSHYSEEVGRSSEMLKETGERFSVDFAKILEMPPELKAALKKAGTIEKLLDKCITNNWVFPYSVSAERKIEIGESDARLDNIDDILFDFYSSSDLKRLIDESFSASDYFNFHLFKIEQTVNSYYSGYYFPCLTALCAILEGMIAQFAEDPNQYISNGLKKSVHQKFGHLSPGLYAQDYFLWKSILSFLDKFYSNDPFAEAEPNFINRNWILHGRTKNHASQLGCLKLFSALLGVNKLVLLYIEDQEDLSDK